MKAMPKFLFYGGTAFCLFLALTSAAEAVSQLRHGTLTFIALPGEANAAWTIAAAFLAGFAIAALFMRMAALLAARNLFAAFVAVLSVTGALATLAALLLVQYRVTAAGVADLGEVHFAVLMAFGFFLSLSMLSLRPYFSIQASRFLSALVFFPLPLFVLVLAQEMFVSASPAPLPVASPASGVFFAVLMAFGFFLSLSMLSLRPYFSIQASRFLSAMVFFPLPLFVLMLAQEMFVSASPAPMPAATPASGVFFAVLAILFFSIAVHCIRHRHLFLEISNLRELLDSRVDPGNRPGRIGGVAFDS